MKLCFISANNYQNPYPVYPIGVSYLMTYLEERLPECEISLFDCNIDGDYDHLHDFFKNGRYDMAAVSLRNIDDNNVFSDNRFITHYEALVKTLRSADSSVPIVIGGPGFSIFPELIFDRLKVEYGIKGEGEESLTKLINALNKGLPTNDIEGLVYKNHKGEILINDRKTFIHSPKLRMYDRFVPYYFDRSGMLNVQTKRGCPFNCIFCSYPIIDGRKVRTLDTDTVVDNIVEMNRKFGVDYLFFTDSIFNIQREYNEELCHKIIETGINIHWGAYFSPNNLERKDLKLFQKSGLTHIEWGTDTLSDATLESYHKSFKWSDIKQTSQWASELGIYYAHFIILGGVGETVRTLKETFDRSRELGFTVFFPYIGMRIYPGTSLYDISLSEGIISADDNLVEPRYYISKEIDVSNIKEMAASSGQKWIFPEDNNSPLIEKFRRKKCRGPLWEFLRF